MRRPDRVSSLSRLTQLRSLALCNASPSRSGLPQTLEHLDLDLPEAYQQRLLKRAAAEPCGLQCLALKRTLATGTYAMHNFFQLPGLQGLTSLTLQLWCGAQPQCCTIKLPQLKFLSISIQLSLDAAFRLPWRLSACLQLLNLTLHFSSVGSSVPLDLTDLTGICSPSLRINNYAASSLRLNMASFRQLERVRFSGQSLHELADEMQERGVKVDVLD